MQEGHGNNTHPDRGARLRSKFRGAVVFFVVSILTVGALMNIWSSKADADEIAPHLHKRQLENGLTLIVKETPGTKVATVQIWVKAGSTYEGPNEGGITHLIEHMIFKGTPTRGLGQVAGSIEEAGGSINAYTSYEYTVYHATLSSRSWGMAMDVLADAVLNSMFDPQELEKEKKVVLEEIRMRRDRPATRLFEELMANAYSVHPYRLPISGTEESVSSFSRDDILRYMEKHYHPENFTVVVVGDVGFRPVYDKVNDLMGGLVRKGAGEEKLPREPEQTASKFFVVREDLQQSHLALAIPIGSFSDEDTPVIDVLSSILGSGETSRLYQSLRNEKGLVYRINASAFTPRWPGLLEVTATLEPEKTEQALAGILTEIFKLKFMPVTDEELERAKRNLESDFVFNLERAEGQARVIGSFEFLSGDPREDEYLDRVRSVSEDDIRRVANKYFGIDRITAGVVAPTGAALSLDADGFAGLIGQAEEAARNSLPLSLLPEAYLPNVHRFALPNGVVLLVREDRTVPTVGVRIVFPGGLRGETELTSGAFAFIADLLPKATGAMSARELAVAVGNMAGSITGFNGKNTFGVKADFLKRFFDEGMELVRDVVRDPAFDPHEAEKIRSELLSKLRHQEDSLPALAFREFNRHLFQGHPYGLNSLGSEASLKALTTIKLKEIYQRHAIPEKMVIAISGDVEAEHAHEVIKRLFADWPRRQSGRSAIAEEAFLAPEPYAAPFIQTLERDKEQVHIIIGFLGGTLTSPDRYAVEMLDTILSGQSGRLFGELRDKMSLAYSLSSFSLMGLDTGSFGVYLATSPDKKDEAVRALWKQMYRLQEELVTGVELQKARNVLISQYELGLQTHTAQALEMALNETYGLGQDFGSRYVTHIEKVTPEDIRAAARKYIQSDHYVMVTVGATAPAAAAPEAEAATPKQ